MGDTEPQLDGSLSIPIAAFALRQEDSSSVEHGVKNQPQPSTQHWRSPHGFLSPTSDHSLPERSLPGSQTQRPAVPSTRIHFLHDTQIHFPVTFTPKSQFCLGGGCKEKAKFLFPMIYSACLPWSLSSR